MTQEPSKNQREAIQSMARRVLIVAGPGSGKTFTMVQRGQHLLESHLVDDADRMLYMTFTVKAAGEIEERFPGVNSHTFHAFCFRLLQEYGDRVSLGASLLKPPFTVMDEPDQIALMQEVLADLRWKMSPNKIVEWYNLGEPPGREPVLPKGMTLDSFKSVLFEYEQRKADSNAVDFRGLVTVLLRILITDPDYLLYLRNRYEAIFIDEGQDTDPIQMVLVRMLLRDETFLTVVGDTDQTLYSWRMANPGLLLGKRVPVLGLPPEIAGSEEHAFVTLGGWGRLQDFMGWEHHFLGENYRSARRIVFGTHHVILNNQDRHALPLAPVRTEDGEVYEYTYNFTEEGPALLRLLAFLKEKGGTLAVLTRTNYLAGQVARYIREDGRWPHYHVGEEDALWEDVHAKRLLYVLKACSNRFDRWTALRVIHMIAKRLDANLVASVRNLSAASGRTIMDVALELDPALSADLEGVRHVQEMPDEPGKILAALAVAKNMLAWLPVHERIEEYAGGWARAGRTLASFLFFVSYHKETFREKKEMEPGTIWVSTVHKAKGKEWDNVVVAGAEPGEFPTRNADNPEEERRIFYVASTRPRLRLVFAHTDQRIRFGKTVAAGRSQYIEEGWPVILPPTTDGWPEGSTPLWIGEPGEAPPHP